MPLPRFLCCFLLLACSCTGGETKRTNVILIVVDTLRADALDEAATPNIDRLARDGVSYPLAFSHAPSTLPATVALLSSQVPHSSGVVRNGERVPSELELFPAWIGRQGWHTEAVVSLATLWPAERGSGIDRGFVTWRTTEHEVGPAGEVCAQLPALLLGERPDRGLFLLAHFCEPHQPYDAYGSETSEAELLLGDRVIERLSIADTNWWEGEIYLPAGGNELTIRSSRPFLLRSFRAQIAGRRAPTSYDYADPTLARKEVAIRLANPSRNPMPAKFSLWIHDSPDIDKIPGRYRREVEAADAAIGWLLAELDQRNLYDSSLIVFTSDHGEALGERGFVGHSQNLYDELLHVPLIIKLPVGHSKARALATSRGELARHVDVVPTLVDLLDLPTFRGAMGVSLFETSERVLLAETYPPHAPTRLIALRDREYKMVLEVESDRVRMFDLTQDPGEIRNAVSVSERERPSWREVLRIAAKTKSTRAELDPAALRRLKAFEY